MNRQACSVILSGGLLGGGGVQTHLTLLTKLLRHSADADVTLLGSASQWPTDVLQDVRDAGVRVILPPTGLSKHERLAKLATLFNIRFRLSRGDHTVYCIGEGRIHAHLVKRLAPRAFSVYHEIVDAHNPGMKTVRCAAPVDAYIANSRPVAEGMRAVLPPTGHPVKVIPFLTSSAPVPPPAPRPPVGDRPIRVTYLGRFESHKRPEVLVREWKSIAASPPVGPAELCLYGYGELHQELERMVRATPGLERVVHVRGRYQSDELPRILADADLVVLPSLFEGLPLVLVEAMIAGVPIVACDAGGVREFADDNPDVVVTSTEWDDFVRGLKDMCGRIRRGEIDAQRLYRWTESRYGYNAVSRMWIDALTSPRAFFDASDEQFA